MAFLWKNALIRHRSISLQLVCAKITSSRIIAVERRSVQKLHSSAIALLQIFKLFFAGSQVAGSQVATILWRHICTVYIEDFLFTLHSIYHMYIVVRMRKLELTRCECVRQQWQTIPHFVKCVSCESDGTLGFHSDCGVFQWTDGPCGTAALCVRPVARSAT